MMESRGRERDGVSKNDVYPQAKDNPAFVKEKRAPSEPKLISLEFLRARADCFYRFNPQSTIINRFSWCPRSGSPASGSIMSFRRQKQHENIRSVQQLGQSRYFNLKRPGLPLWYSDRNGISAHRPSGQKQAGLCERASAKELRGFKQRHLNANEDVDKAPHS